MPGVKPTTQAKPAESPNDRWRACYYLYSVFADHSCDAGDSLCESGLAELKAACALDLYVSLECPVRYLSPEARKQMFFHSTDGYPYVSKEVFGQQVQAEAEQDTRAMASESQR